MYLEHHRNGNGNILAPGGVWHAPAVTDFVLARRLHALGPRARVAGWNEVVDALHAKVPLSRAALLVLCDVHSEAETRRLDVVTLLAATGGRLAEARLVRSLDDPAPRVVRAALRGLGGCGTHRSAAALAGVQGAHAPAAQRALARVQERVGRMSGSVSEAEERLDGRLSLARRRQEGRVSLDE